MSFQVTQAMVDMFSANVMHLSQQKSSRLFQYTNQKTQKAESAFYDRIGKREAKDKEGRHAKITYSDTPHSRRRVTMVDKYDADLVDKSDKLRTIMNLENEYAIAIASSLGREMDKIIIDAGLGTAWTGKEGTVPVVLPNSQKIAAFDGSGATGVGLNVATLRAVRKKFKQAEAIAEGEMIILVLAAQQLDDMLAQTEVSSSDYNTIKTLVQGEVDTFLGFKFVQTELLPFNDTAVTYTVTTGAVGAGGGTIAIGQGRRCMAFTNKRALTLGNGEMVEGKITEMPEYHYSNQVYGSFTMGAVRMEEVQLVEIICKEV